MRRNKNMYSGYRGRKSAHEVLITVALVLAAVLVAALAALYLGQRYVIYTDNGIRLDLPFFKEEKAEEKLDPEQITIKEEAAVPEQPEPLEPVVPLEPEVTFQTAVELPLNEILEGTATLEKGQVPIVTMKDREGRLGFVSQRTEAERGDVNSKADEINERLRAWNEEQPYTVARVFCFADNSAPYHMNSLALRATYGNWRDLQQKRWMDPTNPASQDYVAALCGELAALGFDEILLETAGCPIDGNQEAIRWYNTNLSAAVSGTGGFLDGACRAVAETGTRISVRIEENVLSPDAAHGGLTVDGLNLYAYRIWMSEAAQDVNARLAQAGITDVENRLVKIVSEIRENQATHQAQLVN